MKQTTQTFINIPDGRYDLVDYLIDTAKSAGFNIDSNASKDNNLWNRVDNSGTFPKCFRVYPRIGYPSIEWFSHKYQESGIKVTSKNQINKILGIKKSNTIKTGHIKNKKIYVNGYQTVESLVNLLATLHTNNN